MSYGGASQPSPAAAQTASSPSLPATFKSTPPRASVTPPATPAAAVTPPAQPAAPSAETTAPPTPATTSPVWTTGAPAETIRPAEQRRNGFSVQVAAVETRAEADRLVTRFVTQGYSAYVARGEGAAANYYRVRIGAFADRKAAEDVARQLASTEGAKPWIAKEESSSRR
jgi:cell division septation protein DedD